MSVFKKFAEIVDRSDNVDARKNITKLNRDIKFHKEKVKQYIESNYADFMPTVINNEALIEEGFYLEKDLKNVQENIASEGKNIYEANDEISKLVEELEEANIKLNLSMKLTKIDKLLGKIKLYNETEKYTEINNILNAIQLLVDDPEDAIIRRLDMYKNLKTRLALERGNMLKNLECRFNNLVQMKEKSFQKTRAITMIVTKNQDKLFDCANAITESEYDFTTMTDFFMSNIFEPIISRAVSYEVTESENDYSMNLSYSTEPIAAELRPNHVTVFSNIANILNFLVCMNIQLETKEFFLAHIFENHRKELFELIFNECLVHSIPKTFEEKSKCTMTEDIARLSVLFVETNFLKPASDESESDEKLESYSHKVDDLFYQQFTKNIQASASELLKRDLHDMMLISEDTTISTNTPLTFPRSMISKSTLELVRLLEKIIKQAIACSEDDEKQTNLMNAVKTVLENYTFTIQLHHSKFMSKIPQQSALFYNNCMYLSNWLTSNRDTDHCSLDQVGEDLENQGWEILEVQIAKQKIQLLEILNEFDPSQSLNVVLPEHFKPIRQCMRQMDLLKNVWQTILPSDLYSKTMAGLLDVIGTDFIRKVTVMEDISTILATGLVELIKTLDEKGQSLFEADTSAISIVLSWQRMLHLQFILDASLVDITNSWKAGQISQSFKVDEVKRLIRALFQNTDRRANALSSIV